MFMQVTDFNAKYQLASDSILSDDELMRRDRDSGEYLDSSYQQMSLRQRQEEVSSIQLIPQVPESVKEVVRRAKRLYIFGHFEYSFFTIARHYAYAALESALHNRWNATLPLQLVLRHEKSKTISESVTVDRMGWRSIKEYCKNHGWNSHKVFVNGKRFPTSAAKVVEQLREEGIINDWQLWRMRDVYLGLRNSHSHLEFCSTDLPGAGPILRVVEEINKMFDSVQC
jgi:hypothetical protein